MWGHGVGAYDPKFKLGQEFCTVHPPTKFQYPMFNRLEVIVLKDTENTHLIHYAMLVGKMRDKLRPDSHICTLF